MENMKRRVFTLLLSLVMIVGMFCVPGFVTTAQAAGEGLENLMAQYSKYTPCPVSTVSELRSALEGGGQKYIYLTDNISYRTPRRQKPFNTDADLYIEDEKWDTLNIMGDHVLDLNGYSIGIGDNSNIRYITATETTISSETGSKGLFCRVSNGAKLTINDARGTGHITYDGYMLGTHLNSQLWLASSVGMDVYAHYCYRDLFAVSSGGTMIVNGGSLDCGRVKKQWIGAYMWPVVGYYDQVIHGTAIDVAKGGKLLINDGNFTATGVTDNGTRSAVIRASGGSDIAILGGYFSGNKGAHCLRISDDANVEIASGAFKVECSGKDIREANSGGLGFSYSGSRGELGLSAKALSTYPVKLSGASMSLWSQHIVNTTNMSKVDFDSLDIAVVSPSGAKGDLYTYVDGNYTTQIEYYKSWEGMDESKLVELFPVSGHKGSISDRYEIPGSDTYYTWTIKVFKEATQKYSVFKYYEDEMISGFESVPWLDLRAIGHEFAVGKSYLLTAEEHDVLANGTELIYRSNPLLVQVSTKDLALINTRNSDSYETQVNQSLRFSFSVNEIEHFPSKGSTMGADDKYYTWSTTLGYYDPDGNYHLLQQKTGPHHLQQTADETNTLRSSTRQSITFDREGIYTVVMRATLDVLDHTHSSSGSVRHFAIDSKYITVDVTKPHQWVKFADTATCTSDGEVSYKCDDCGKIKTEPSEKTAHIPGTRYYWDDEECWDICTMCGERINIQKHKGVVISKDSDCDGTVTHYQCSRCESEWEVDKSVSMYALFAISNLTGTEDTKMSNAHVWMNDGPYNGYYGDSMFHWKSCKTCGMANKIAHTYEDGACTACGIPEKMIGIVGTGCIHGGKLEVAFLGNQENAYTKALKDGKVQFAWYRDRETDPISTSKTYQPKKADVGHLIRCEVTFDMDNTVLTAFTSDSIPEVSYVNVSGLPATCAKTGIAEHKQCKICGRAFDASGKEIKDITLPMLEHVYDNSCDTECNKCGLTREVVHMPSEGWLSDDNNHYKVCTVCNIKLEEHVHEIGEWSIEQGKKCDEKRELKASCTVCGKEVISEQVISHLFGEWEVKDPTCIEKGSHKRVCSECGEIEEYELPLIDHLVVWVDETQADHESSGMVGHYECAYCGKIFGDENGTTELSEDEIAAITTAAQSDSHTYTLIESDETSHWSVCDCGEKTAAEPHAFSAWEVVKEATHMESGAQARTCSVCGYTEFEETAPAAEHEFELGYDKKTHFQICECGEEQAHEKHTYDKGICTVCGFVKPMNFLQGLARLWWFWLIVGVVVVGGGGTAAYFVLKKKKAAKGKTAEATQASEPSDTN